MSSKKKQAFISNFFKKTTTPAKLTGGDVASKLPKVNGDTSPKENDMNKGNDSPNVNGDATAKSNSKDDKVEMPKQDPVHEDADALWGDDIDESLYDEVEKDTTEVIEPTVEKKKRKRITIMDSSDEEEEPFDDDVKDETFTPKGEPNDDDDEDEEMEIDIGKIKSKQKFNYMDRLSSTPKNPPKKKPKKEMNVSVSLNNSSGKVDETKF